MEDLNAFREILRKDKAERHMSQFQYARYLGIPAGTLRDWLDRNIVLKRPIRSVNRKKLAEKIPGIFAVHPERALAEKTFDEPVFDLQMKLALAREHTETLAVYFLWFLKHKERRMAFRKAMGPEWEKFLNLARGLVSEESLRIAIEEQRIDGKEIAL